MGMDLKPVRPWKSAPRHALTDKYSPGNPIWGRYNWTGWRFITDFLARHDVPMDEFAGTNDGALISSKTCQLVADTIEKHLHELEPEDQMWLKDHIILWRTCGGYKQY